MHRVNFHTLKSLKFLLIIHLSNKVSNLRTLLGALLCSDSTLACSNIRTNYP